MAPILKRTHSDSDDDDDFEVRERSPDVDISDVLAGKRRKVDSDGDEDDDALAELIQDSISKRSKKEGTKLLKNSKKKNQINKGEVGGGSFQSMGLHPALLRSLTLQGYRVPTPIQRQSLPLLLSNPPRDLVGMARTGSGKTLAYMLPLINRLGGRHSTAFGARALILLPTRELALQVVKVGKELARGFQQGQGDHAGDNDGGEGKKGQSLRWGLVVGGEGLDEQFEMITNNPDVIIATPGRLLHLIVEMNLDFKSIQYVVFDEADRLFEMGFEVALSEILARLPTGRQTVLFSATLPKSLVEFAKAGLQEPKLVRLDSESKISPDLRMAFFSIKQAEKDACLLSLLRDVIQVPYGALKEKDDESAHFKKKKPKFVNVAPSPHQTLIFAATKHHVEYLLTLLTATGYAVSHIYGSLDQTARSQQMEQFRKGYTSILVVTDVAARGIDIPVLENVVNYDFPQGARVFVHRVGRTARAGQKGWAWSFVTNKELPSLLDLQLFLGRPLVNSVVNNTDDEYSNNLVLGAFRRETVDDDVEYIRSLEETHHSLPTLRTIMQHGHALYERSKGNAAPQSYTRAKEMTKDPRWHLSASNSSIHPVLMRSPEARKKQVEEDAKKKLLMAVNMFKPQETILEAGSKGTSEIAALMKQRRKALEKSAQRSIRIAQEESDSEEEKAKASGKDEVEMADEEDIAAVFVSSEKKTFRDEEYYLSYVQKDALTEKGYSLNDGASSFSRQAQHVSFDLAGDEGKTGQTRQAGTTWDKKKKKFIQGDGAGSDNKKMIRTESGIRMPASFRSGRFDEWKSKTRISLPRIGETENASSGSSQHGRKFKHNKITAPKPLDKFRTDYERKSYQEKKKAADTDEVGPAGKGKGKGKMGKSRGISKPHNKIKSELKTVDQIRKTRKQQEQRRLKNGRKPQRSKKGRS